MDETTKRLDSIEELMAVHKHTGDVSSILDANESDNAGDLRVGYEGTYSTLPVGEDDQILTPDSSEALGLKWTDLSGLQDLYWKAERGLDNLYIAKLNGLYSGIETSENRYSEKFTIHAEDIIKSNNGKLELNGSNGTAHDENYVTGIVDSNNISDGTFDINGIAEMQCSIMQEFSGTASYIKNILVGWCDSTDTPQMDTTTYTKNHIAFYGYANDFGDDYYLYASVGNGTAQYRVLIDDNFSLTSFKTLKIKVLSDRIEYYVGGTLGATILFSDTSCIPTTNSDDYQPMIFAQNEDGTAYYNTLYIQLNGYFINTIKT